MTFVLTLLQPFASFFSQDPDTAMMQAGLLFVVVMVLFFLFFTLRDIVLRTRSFVFQCVCILLVALLPGIGFLLYLLIRPARTIKEREMEAMLRAVAEGMFGDDDEEMWEEVVVGEEDDDESEDDDDDEEEEEVEEEKADDEPTPKKHLDSHDHKHHHSSPL
jgi:hypothetical protein